MCSVTDSIDMDIIDQNVELTCLKVIDENLEISLLIECHTREETEKNLWYLNHMWRQDGLLHLIRVIP